MSRVSLLAVVPLLFACSTAEVPRADTAAAVSEAPAVQNFAGTWTVNTLPENKDTVLLTSTLVATSEDTGWKLTLPGRDPMDLQVVARGGDSVVTTVGPYSSALQPGISVSLVITSRVDGDRISGPMRATYHRAGSDSVVMLRLNGTRQ